MKKSIYLALALTLGMINSVGAVETEFNTQLIPANSLEEMVNAGVSENFSVSDFDDHSFHHRHEFVCFARNRRGQRFEARGFSVREAQERVLHECRRVSVQCFELGCHQI